MVKRNRVALIYTYNENWIGGTYYIENLIAALSKLPDRLQPHLLIFTMTAGDIKKLQLAVNYPYWSFRSFERSLSLTERALNKFTSKILHRSYISTLCNDVDIVFPLTTGLRHFFSRVKHHLFWISDFQEHYLPSFFTPEEILLRKIDQKLILQSAKSIVFSSYSAQNDFRSIYPENKLNQYVLQFAVVNNQTLEHVSTYLSKYGITKPYFICSNQFWKHKNHQAVLNALHELKNIYPQSLVVFTGQETDYRNPTHFQEILALREVLGLQEHTKFLGFIPRKEQLILMKAAIAVIQPSLFEGWSTVIEDAKSMSVPLIASAISVHKEQLEDYEAKLFFSPENPTELAACIAQMFNEKQQHSYNYSRSINKFAHDFISIINTINAK